MIPVIHSMSQNVAHYYTVLKGQMKLNNSNLIVTSRTITFTGGTVTVEEEMQQVPLELLLSTPTSTPVSACKEICCTQRTNCAMCGKYKHTPLRRDELGGYVCLTCIDKALDDGILPDVWGENNAR